MQIGAKAGLGALGALAITLMALLAPPPRGEAAGPAQPIAFPHKTHVQVYKIDCQYCHSEARRSEYAGIPSVTRCMGCHKITAADRPEIKKLHDYFNKKAPIPWVRVHKLPEFVHFPHERHIKAGLACQTCHGPVETMTVAEQIAPLTMGWCIECHVQRKGPLDCMVCHH